MNWKTFAIAVSIIMLLSTIDVSALERQATISLVILVSDNPADMTDAQILAKYTGGMIVQAGWHEYDERIIDQIKELNPDQVIIIGGPKAVLPDYEEKLKELGIKYKRLWGETRIETAQKVYEWMFENGVKIDGDVIFVNAWDNDLVMALIIDKPDAAIIPIDDKNKDFIANVLKHMNKKTYYAVGVKVDNATQIKVDPQKVFEKLKSEAEKYKLHEAIKSAEKCQSNGELWKAMFVLRNSKIFLRTFGLHNSLCQERSKQ